MKKTFIAASLLFYVSFCSAQDHSQQPSSLQDHIKKTNEMLQKELQMTTTQQQKVQQAFKAFFQQVERLHEQNPPPPPPPMNPEMKESFGKLVKERDEKVKLALTEDQYKRFLDLEKKWMPPPPQPPPPPLKDDHKS